MPSFIARALILFEIYRRALCAPPPPPPQAQKLKKKKNRQNRNSTSQSLFIGNSQLDFLYKLLCYAWAICRASNWASDRSHWGRRAGKRHGNVGMRAAGNNNQMVAKGNMTADYCIKSCTRHTRDNFVIFFQFSSTKKVKCNLRSSSTTGFF